MAWLILLCAVLFEIAFALLLKLSNGFTRPHVAAVTLIAMVASVGLLSLAIRSIPIGLAYAVWASLGAAGAIIGGAFLFDERLSLMQLLALALILFGVVLLKANTSTTEDNETGEAIHFQGEEH